MKIEQTIIYQVDLLSFHRKIENQIEGASIHLLRPDDINRLREVWPVNIKAMRKRIKRGDMCFVAEDKDGLVHYSWVQFRGFHHIKPAARTILVRSGQLWIYHCRTAERFRGKGIYPTVLTHILEFGHDSLLKDGIIYTTIENKPSQNGIVKSGFKLVKILYSAIIGEYTIPLTSKKSININDAC